MAHVVAVERDPTGARGRRVSVRDDRALLPAALGAQCVRLLPAGPSGATDALGECGEWLRATTQAAAVAGLVLPILALRSHASLDFIYFQF